MFFWDLIGSVPVQYIDCFPGSDTGNLGLEGLGSGVQAPGSAGGNLGLHMLAVLSCTAAGLPPQL